MIGNCSPKIISSKLGSPFGLRPRSGLGSGSARARNYSALFGLRSAQGSARASRLTKLGARLGIRSISARSGSDRAEYGMDRVEMIQSSPNPRSTDPNPVQSS